MIALATVAIRLFAGWMLLQALTASVIPPASNAHGVASWVYLLYGAWAVMAFALLAVAPWIARAIVPASGGREVALDGFTFEVAGFRLIGMWVAVHAIRDLLGLIAYDLHLSDDDVAAGIASAAGPRLTEAAFTIALGIALLFLAPYASRMARSVSPVSRPTAVPASDESSS